MATRELHLGVDVGGTAIKYGLVDCDNQLLFHDQTPLGDRQPADIAVIVNVITAAQSRARKLGADIRGVGIAAPGNVDPASGHVRSASNLGWLDVNLRAEVSSAVSVPVTVMNDSNAAAIAEWQALGRQSRSDNLISVTVGTGIGSGLVINGELFTGDDLSCGEIGHMFVPGYDDLACSCGRTGCLEAIASATGIIRTYNALRSADTNRSRERRRESSLRHLVHEARQGDEIAAQSIERATSALGLQLANLSTYLGIETIVIGGGVTEMDWPFVARVSDHARVCLGSRVPSRFSIRKSTMVHRSGIIGAVINARKSINKFQRHPTHLETEES